MLAAHDVDKELLCNKVFHMSKNHFCLSPYEKDMDHIILKDSQITEKELEENMINVLPLMGYAIIPSNKEWSKKNKLSQYKLPSGGVIDILTMNKRNLIGFELKKGRETGTHLTQILSYLNDLNEMNPSTKNKIIMVAFDYTDRFVEIIENQNKRFLSTGGRCIELWTYRMDVEKVDYITLVKGHEPRHNYIPFYTREEARSIGYQLIEIRSRREGKHTVNKNVRAIVCYEPFREDLDFKQDIKNNPTEQDIKNNPPVSMISRIKNYVRVRVGEVV